MNETEKAMVDLLSDLRNNHGVSEVKAEFESEGARLNELMRLKDIASRCGVGFVLKIGGPEAIRDIFDALNLGVSGIVAPMVESQYALKKFLDAITAKVDESQRGEIEFAINIETFQACNNFDAMLTLPEIRLLKRITIGRVDLCGSMSLSRKEINSKKVLKIAKNVYEKARRAGFETTIGGGISAEAIPFLTKLVEEDLLDRFETRKIVFDSKKGLQNAEASIRKANLFELHWLCNKHDYYNSIAVEDKDRIRMIEKRGLK